jgi:general secretion pathway protein D
MKCRPNREPGIKLGQACLILMVLMGLMMAAACAGPIAFKRGEEAYRAKDWDRSVELYSKAVQSDPENPRYRMTLAKALIEASNYHLDKAEQLVAQNEWKLAVIELQKALDFNAENVRARKRKAEILAKVEEERKKGAEKTEIERIKEKAAKIPLARPLLGPASEMPILLKFTDQDLKDAIFPALQKTGGINFLFDKDFTSKKISIALDNVTFKEALDQICLSAGVFYKILNERTILIIPDTPAKRDEYEELVLKIFYLSNGDVERIQGLLRTLANINTVAIDPDLRAILLREPPNKIEIAEKIINAMDKAKAEVFVDVEILEVNKSRMREYGIDLSLHQITESLISGLPTDTSGTQDSSSSTTQVRGNALYSLNASDFLFSLPSISFKLLESDTKSKVIAKPQLRVLDGEPLSIQVGDKVPSPQTSFVPIAMGGVSQQAISSFQLLDIGIKIELTPHIHHNGDITLKLKFEMSFITVPGTVTVPPTIGNRTVTTVIRMRDGETGLLAGLLRDSERKSLHGFPGINSIPILNKIFGGTEEEVSQTDIILRLTPRITRMPDITEEDLTPIWVGTKKEMTIKAPPGRSPFDSREGREEIAAKGGEKAAKKEFDEPVLSVEPALSEVPPGIEFMETVVLQNVKRVSNFVGSLRFDPKILQVKEVREGDFLSRDGAKTVFIKSFNNVTGEIQIGLSREEFREGVSGTGEVVQILFAGSKAGKATITISQRSVRTDKGLEVPVALFEGEVVVK